MCPVKSFFVFIAVVDIKMYPAEYLGHIYPFGAYPEIFLHKQCAAVRAAYPLGVSAEPDIGLRAHPADSHGAAGEPEQLFRNIGRYAHIIRVLHIGGAYREHRQSARRIGRHSRRKIERTRTLGAVEAPYRFHRDRIVIHSLGDKGTAGADCERCCHIEVAEIFLRSCSLGSAADSERRHHAFNRLSVGIAAVFGDKLLCCACHSRSLFLKCFPYPETTSVDNGANTDPRIHSSTLCPFSDNNGI